MLACLHHGLLLFQCGSVQDVAALCCLQCCCKLKGMRRHHTVIMIGSGNHCCRVAGAFLYIMHRRIFIQIFKHFFAVICSAIIISPACAGSKFMITQHIHHTNRRKANLVQVGALRHTGAYQQTAVGAA